jgi:TolB protein
MKPRYYFFIAVGLVLVLGIYFVLSTAPKSPDKTGTVQATPTVNLSQRLTGERLEGQLLFTRQGNLWAWHGDNATRLAIEPGRSVIANVKVTLTQPAWSPGSGAIAYIRQDESFSDLWVVNADGTNARSLTANKGKGQPRTGDYNETSLWAFAPSWSPDGTQLAYLSDVQTDDLALWVTPVKTPAPRRLSTLAVGQGGMQRPAWSPDGAQIAVAAYEGGKPQIFTIKVNGGAQTRLTEAGEGAYDPAWSPDGQYLAYVVRRGNTGDLWMMKADGSGQVQLASGFGPRNPVWSPDGSKVGFLGLRNGGFEIFTVNINPNGSGAAGEPKQISRDARIDAAGGLSWSR